MTIREVFDELAGGGDADPADALADRGYGELPEPLLSEAIVSYADTAPVEVAEHLSPFVMVHSAVPVDLAAEAAASDGLALLASAPEPIVLDDPDPGAVPATGQETGQQDTGGPEIDDLSYDGGLALDFDFGQGDLGGAGLAGEGTGAGLPGTPEPATPQAEPGQAWEDTAPLDAPEPAYADGGSAGEVEADLDAGTDTTDGSWLAPAEPAATVEPDQPEDGDAAAQ